MNRDAMSFFEHLTDLRKRLIYIFLAFFVVLIVSLVFVTKLYGFFVHPIEADGYRLVVVSPGEIVTAYLSIAAVVAVGVTLPYALLEVWRFVSPGLTPTERRHTLRLLPFALVMFIAGVCFAWFVVFPTILHFLLQLAAQKATVMIRVNLYFSFLTSICLPFGFIFELPIAVIFLTRLQIVSPKLLRKLRRYAYVAIVILGVFISPPELISHLSVITPMMALYELSILLSILVSRRVARRVNIHDEVEKNLS